MILTNKQQEGLNIAVARYKAKERWTCISGYAGSGKTTLVRFIINALQVNPEEDVAYIAFTGKAAQVLRQKGCPNAMTAHRLLYYSKPTPSGRFIYTPRPSIPYKIVVVDEVSMLSKELWELLLSHKVYIIACGDPGQLPPVSKDACTDILDHPHIFLDEIMRQAQESEIIRLSMDIREGRPIEYTKGNEIQVIPGSEIVGGMYLWADQIITATNNARFQINALMREAANRGPQPEIGDKIICNRNCWDISDMSETNALVNGTIGYITNINAINYMYPHRSLATPVPLFQTSFKTEYGDEFIDVPIDQLTILDNKKFLTPQQEYLFFKSPQLKMEPMPIEFNYGYAITCHRSQGSQWDKVLVLEEKFPFDREEHKRWLYTAVTRAAEKLVLVR
jgi:exodeoxyribonuclease-5